MPTIPSMTLPSSAIDASEIYQNGLYAPANPPQSVEVLNGSLEQANYNGGANTIKPYMMDLGTFARGYSANFSRREFVYARQLDEEYENHTIVSCSISTRVFLPYDVRVLQYGFQCWFNHDASAYDSGESTEYEFWRYKFNVLDESSAATIQASKALTGRLPYGRERGIIAPYTWNENDGAHEEARWYYVHKTGMLRGSILKGYKDLKLVISASIKSNGKSTIDSHIAKNQLMSGSIWMLALR